MEVRTVLLNARSSFHDPDIRSELVEELKWGIDADIALFTEAYDADQGQSDEVLAAVEQLESEGYNVTRTSNNDSDGRLDMRAMMAVSRFPMTSEVLNLGSRNALQLHIDLPNEAGAEQLDVFGFHGDDRSPATRVAQTRALLGSVDEAIPTLMLAQMNATHGDSRKDRLLHRTGPKVARLLGTIDPGEYSKLSGAGKLKALPGRVGSLSLRVSGQVDGEPVRMLESAGFQDADPEREVTISSLMGAVAMQVDYALLSRHFSLDQVISRETRAVETFKKHPPTGIQHRAVLTTISI